MDPFDLRAWEGFKQAGGVLEAPAMIDQVAIDSRRLHSPHSLFVALPGETQDGHNFVAQAAELGAKYAIVSTQWNAPSNLKEIQLLRTANPLRAFQEVARSYRLSLPTKIIAVTGSFGKTMVKDLLLLLLKTQKRSAASPESFNSQIGVALSLMTLTHQDELAIIEAAISKKNEMDILADLIRPDFTILTPMGNKHLATLEDLETLASEMIKLVNLTKCNGWALLPNDPLIQQQIKISSYYFWNEADPYLPHASSTSLSGTTLSKYQLTFPDQTSFVGEIASSYSYFLNLINMTAKAAWLHGISSENILSVYNKYRPEPMRTEIWKVPSGAVFINDTYCSDPQSIDNALKHFKYANQNQRKIFLFGGMSGDSLHADNDYKRIGQALAQADLSQLYLYGNKPYSALIAELKKNSPSMEILVLDNLEEALNFLKQEIKPTDCILIKGEKKLPLDLLCTTFNDSLNNNQCFINLAVIKSNLSMIAKKLPEKTRMMVVIKALAYGTDDLQMAKFLITCGIDIFGVSYVEEGVALRRAGIQHPIFSINAAIYEVNKVVRWDLEVGVSDKEFIIALAEAARIKDKQIKVTLHINTGMGRFGCRPEEALELAQLILSQPNLILEGAMTHFSSAEDPEADEFTYSQIRCFDQTLKQLEDHGISLKWTHAASSSGAIRLHLPQYNMVRIGIAAYGLYSSEAVKNVLKLNLAHSLSSRIVGINICKKGEYVSYGRSYAVEADTQRIAVLPIGYFDGLHRNYSGKSHVLIQGKKALMIGSICMDYMMVDITQIPSAKVGDPVLIFGEDEFGQYLSPEDLAQKGNSIIHELITCLGPRIQRIFVYEESRQIR